MFYTTNDNYMQDLNCYNQMQNPTFNPYMTNSINTMPNNIGFNQDTSMMSQGFIPNQNMMFDNSRNMMANNQMGFQNNIPNPNSLFPSIYRIINPVVGRVLSGTNTQFLTEDTLNNLVDTVYNIVEGQIEMEDEQINRNVGVEERSTSSNLNTNTTSSNNTSNSNISNSSRSATLERTTTTTNSSSNNISSNQRHNRSDSILRDLIKILILREWLSRNQRGFIANYQTGFFNPNFMQQSNF